LEVLLDKRHCYCLC